VPRYPDDGKLLKDGDIVNIDVTVIKDDFHGDTSKMFIVGKPTILGERLCRITQESLYLALKMVKPGINLRTIGAAIRNSWKPKVSPWCANTAVTVSAAASMKSRRCCTTTAGNQRGAQTRHDLHHRADGQRG
jgi:methionine aminopeptidase